MSVAHGIAQPRSRFGPIQRDRHPDKDQRRAEHPSHRGGERHRGARGRVQRAARCRRLGHLLRGQREEERHPDIVDEEMESSERSRSSSSLSRLPRRARSPCRATSRPELSTNVFVAWRNFVGGGGVIAR